MNKENLLRAADLVETIPQEMFNMGWYRYGEKKSHTCNSMGCILGYSTALMLYPEIPKMDNGEIDFTSFGLLFFETTPEEFTYLFQVQWEHTDNTPTGAAARMRYVAEYGPHETWFDEMSGRHPLSYAHLVKEK